MTDVSERDVKLASSWDAKLRELPGLRRRDELAKLIAIERALTTRTSAVMTLQQIKQLLVQADGQPIEKVGPLLFQAIVDFVEAIETDYSEFMKAEGNAHL